MIVDSNRWTDKIILKEDLDKLKEKYLYLIKNGKIIEIKIIKDSLITIGKEIVNKKDEYILTLDEHDRNNKRIEIEKLYDEYQENIEIVDLISKRVLIISGKMGTGKSHLLAYFVENNCIKFNNETILILGQHLNEEKLYKLQIKEYLELDETFEEFIRNLNAIGKEKNIYIPIIIDAINESKTRENWKEQFNSIINIILQYDYVKLVVSLREDYYDICIPEDIDEKFVKVVEHRGFEENTYQAMSEIFNYYNVPIPLFPIINEEYSNPLFLISTCKWIRDYKIDILLQDYESFETIFEKFIEIVNSKIAQKYKFNSSNQLLDDIFQSISNYLIDNSKLNFTQKEFCEITRVILQDYPIKPITLLNELKSEGLLFESRYAKENIYYFAYEKYISILNARALVKRVTVDNKINISKIKEILYMFIYDIELLKNIFIIIGNKYSIEYFDIFDKVSDDNITYSYFKSLVWRKKENFDKNNKFSDFMNEISKESYYSNEAYDELFYYCSAIETSPFNIHRYNKLLLKMTMPERDYKFTINIDYEKANNIIKYCLHSNMEQLVKNNKLMLAITLSWFCVSSNRNIRDNSTKALVNILTNNVEIMLELLKNFKLIDDMYILERIYASCYGALLRSEKIYKVKELGDMVYRNIFELEETLPNIVIRYYAKNIILYIKHIGVVLELDESKLNSPFNSKWYESIPTNEEIKKYQIDYTTITNDTSYLCSQNSIIHSMLTESAKDLGMYGDFGRYNFGYRVSPWVKNFASEQDLSNIVIKRVFDMGYNVKLFGNYDKYQTERIGDRHAHARERIGKKYQWIAMYELMARLQDNYFCYIDICGDEEYDPSYEYYTYNMKKTKEVKNASYRKQYYNECENQLLNIDVTNLIQIPEKTKKYIRGELDDNWLNDDIKAENYIHSDNETILSFSVKFEKEKLDLLTVEYGLYNEYSYHASMDVIFQAYLYEGELDLSSDELNGMFAGPSIRYNILLMEYPWKNLKRIEFNNERENCYITNHNYNYSSEYDHSVIETGNNNLEQPSHYLVNKLNLKQKSDGYWYDDKDELVCYDRRIKTGDSVFVINSEKLRKLLEENKINILWMGYVEKKYNKKIREYKYILKLKENGEFEYQKYGENSWEIKY